MSVVVSLTKGRWFTGYEKCLDATDLLVPMIRVGIRLNLDFWIQGAAL
jgi:hypothetical protein